MCVGVSYNNQITEYIYYNLQKLPFSERFQYRMLTHNPPLIRASDSQCPGQGCPSAPSRGGSPPRWTLGWPACRPARNRGTEKMS